MTRRVFITPGRVSISRKGYDVLSVPRTSDYMALDSDIDIERPLQIGVLFNVPMNNANLFAYGTTYPAPPAIELYEWNGDRAVALPALWRYEPTGGTTDIRSPFYTFGNLTSWGFRTPAGGYFDTSYLNAARHWLFIIWKTW